MELQNLAKLLIERLFYLEEGLCYKCGGDTWMTLTNPPICTNCGYQLEIFPTILIEELRNIRDAKVE